MFFGDTPQKFKIKLYLDTMNLDFKPNAHTDLMLNHTTDDILSSNFYFTNNTATNLYWL